MSFKCVVVIFCAVCLTFISSAPHNLREKRSPQFVWRQQDQSQPQNTNAGWSGQQQRTIESSQTDNTLIRDQAQNTMQQTTYQERQDYSQSTPVYQNNESEYNQNNRFPPPSPENDQRSQPPPRDHDYDRRPPPPPPRDHDYDRRPPPPPPRDHDYDRRPPPRDYDYDRRPPPPPPRDYDYDRRPPPPHHDYNRGPPSHDYDRRPPPPPPYDYDRRPPPHHDFDRRPPPPHYNDGRPPPPPDHGRYPPPPPPDHGRYPPPPPPRHGPPAHYDYGRPPPPPPHDHRPPPPRHEYGYPPPPPPHDHGPPPHHDYRHPPPPPPPYGRGPPPPPPHEYRRPPPPPPDHRPPHEGYDHSSNDHKPTTPYNYDNNQLPHDYHYNQPQTNNPEPNPVTNSMSLHDGRQPLQQISSDGKQPQKYNVNDFTNSPQKYTQQPQTSVDLEAEKIVFNNSAVEVFENTKNPNEVVYEIDYRFGMNSAHNFIKKKPNGVPLINTDHENEANNPLLPHPQFLSQFLFQALPIRPEN